MKSVETTVVYGQSKKLGIYAVASAVNAIAANGAKNISVSVRIMIPMHAFKSRINTMEKNIKSICKEKGIVLKEIISERNPVITQCMVIASAWGMDKCTDEVMADAKQTNLLCQHRTHHNPSNKRYRRQYNSYNVVKLHYTIFFSASHAMSA
jgi:hypothetical protein